jgi:outer membrane receptor protein involved in Fe transport
VRGKITDQQGLPLPGASIYLRSDKIMGIKTFITSDTGIFQFRALLPGTYQLTLEMPGFKTAKIDDIIIHAGRTITLTVRMEMTTIDEEIVLDIRIPTIDEQGSRAASIIDLEMLTHIPFQRDLREAISSAAGIVPDLLGYPQAAVLNGGSERDAIYITDSLNLADPLASSTPPRVNYDIAHEIEVETTGHPAEVTSTEAGYINVVTRSGGPGVRGELLVHHTNENMIKWLDAPQELADQNLTNPASRRYLWDTSLSLYGTLYGDLLRFYTNVKYVSEKRDSTFSSWTDPQGIEHSPYEGKYSDKSVFFRLTGKFTPEFKFIGTGSYAHRSTPTYSDFSSSRLPQEATAQFSPSKDLLLTGWLNYIMNRKTFIDLKASYVIEDSTLLLNESGADKPMYIDEVTGYSWGSGYANNKQKVTRFMGSATLVHFNDRILGGNQKFKLGVDYDSTTSEWNTWKTDNLIVHYANGDPYYFGVSESPTGETVGTGKVAFSLLGSNQDSYFTGIDLQRLGIFIQDTVTIAGRVTFNLGLRFDRSTADIRESIKLLSANPISFELGEVFIKPVSEVNPYSTGNFSSWDKVLAWNSFSPRLGMVIDVLGNGQALIKASYARYRELLRAQSVAPLIPYYIGRQHEFFWFDINDDQAVNSGDAFYPFPEDYRIYHPEYWRGTVADGVTAPYIDEAMIGFESEFIKDFSVRLSYIYKEKKEILEDVLYNPDTGTEWYTKSKDKEGWWVPYDTVVPAGVDDYENSLLTLYYPSVTSPLLYYRLNNVRELGRKYRGLELVFRKRMSNNWQLMGSVVYSKTTGNLGVGPLYSTPFSPAANSPNYFVNLTKDSPLDYDIPLTINLMGTYHFPYDFYLSFYYSYLRGYIWARDVTVTASTEWADENDAFVLPARVYSEPFGTRRYDSYSNLNLRLEKDFRTGIGRFNAALDVFNTLGARYHLYDLNDGGLWLPSDEDTAEGERAPNPLYGQGVNLRGVREFRFTLGYYF